MLITRQGKPVARLVSAGAATDDIYNFFAGKGVIVGDVVAPVFSDEDWRSLK